MTRLVRIINMLIQHFVFHRCCMANLKPAFSQLCPVVSCRFASWMLKRKLEKRKVKIFQIATYSHAKFTKLIFIPPLVRPEPNLPLLAMLKYLTKINYACFPPIFKEVNSY